MTLDSLWGGGKNVPGGGKKNRARFARANSTLCALRAHKVIFCWILPPPGKNPEYAPVYMCNICFRYNNCTYNKIQNNPKPNYIVYMYYKYQSCISSSHHTHIQNMYMSLYTITQHTHAYYVSRLYNVHTNQKYERCCL